MMYKKYWYIHANVMTNRLQDLDYAVLFTKQLMVKCGREIFIYELRKKISWALINFWTLSTANIIWKKWYMTLTYNWIQIFYSKHSLVVHSLYHCDEYD